jgi:hypothetical protein
MNPDPNLGFLCIAMPMILGGLAGISAPEYWVGLTGGNVKAMRIWCGLWLAVGVILAVVSVARIIF